MSGLRETVRLHGKIWDVEVLRRRIEPPSAPRIITVCYNQSSVGVEIAQAAIASVVRCTPIPHEIWVVDNVSPEEHRQWLRAHDTVNVILNNTVPIPTEKTGWRTRLGLRHLPANKQIKYGSFANGVGLDLAAWAIDPNTQYIFVMHSDVLLLRDSWLPFLQGKLNDQVKIAAMLADKHPVRINGPHVSGLLLDFTLYHPLKLTFLPNAPRFDVGDQLTHALRGRGYQEYVCRNTHNDPDLAKWIPESDPFKTMDHVARAFDDSQNMIWAHLGRGTPKAIGTYTKSGRTSAEIWLNVVRHYASAMYPKT